MVTSVCDNVVGRASNIMTESFAARFEKKARPQSNLALLDQTAYEFQ